MATLQVIDRDGVSHDVEAKPGLKVMEILRELDYGVAAICGGMCSCATCHIYVDPAWADKLPPPMSDETKVVRSAFSDRRALRRRPRRATACHCRDRSESRR